MITSPPYLGTYDYTAHHRRRFGWLGFDPALLEEREIGARRRPSPGRYRQDVMAYLGELARVLRPGAFAYLLIGDSTAGAEVIPGDLEIRRAAAECDLEVVAVAAQGRPENFAPARGILPEGKREHLIALRRR